MARVLPDAAGFDPRLAWPLGAFLALLFALPLALLAGLSLQTPAGLGLSQYAKFLGDAFSLGVLGGTMRLGAEVTLACLVLGLPLAWLHARSSPTMRGLLMLVVLLPLLTSVVVRTFAWIVVLGRQDIVNSALLGMGVIDTPLRLLYTEGGVVAALTQVQMPLMVLQQALALGDMPFASAMSVIFLVAVLLVVLLGVAGALGLARSCQLSARALDGLFMAPLILPALAFGLAALMLFSAVGLPVSPLTLTLGHTVVCVPFMVRNTVASLQQLDPSLLEGSATLGASRFYTFRRVVLPLVRPGILAGGFICFMASFDNIPVSLFLRDAATDMLPIRMWQDLDVTIAALSGVLIVATVAAMLLMERLAGLSRRIT